MNKFPVTVPLTDRDIQEGEEEAVRVRQDIHRENLTLARAIDKMVEEEA